MLVESYVPTDEIRELRVFVRTRKGLVDERTAKKNGVRAVFKRTGNTYDSELFGANGQKFRQELPLSDADRTIIDAHLLVIEEHDEQIEALEDQIDQHVLESAPVQRLLSIPGVGQFTAAVIVAEVGEFGRFD